MNLDIGKIIIGGIVAGAALLSAKAHGEEFTYSHGPGYSIIANTDDTFCMAGIRYGQEEGMALAGGGTLGTGFMVYAPTLRTLGTDEASLTVGFSNGKFYDLIGRVASGSVDSYVPAEFADAYAEAQAMTVLVNGHMIGAYNLRGTAEIVAEWRDCLRERSTAD